MGLVNPAEPDGLGRSSREFLGTFAASMGPDNYVDAGRSVCHAFQEEPPSLLSSSILCSAEVLVFSWPWILVRVLMKE